MLFKLAILACIGFVASTPVGTCPATNTRPPTHLPHATDCTLYFVCHLGTPILMPPCPNGQEFDMPLNRCVPAPANCAADIPTTPGPLPTIPPIPDTTTTEATTTTEETTTTEATTTTVITTELTTPAIPNTPPTAPTVVPTAPPIIPTVPGPGP